jgi:hypothetical protein
MRLRAILLLAPGLISSAAYAVPCGPAVALLANSPEVKSVTRAALFDELAGLYLACLNQPFLVEHFEATLREQALREGVSPLDLLAEVEKISLTPEQLRDNAEQRRAQREREHQSFYSGMAPYLDALTKADRAVIEEQLLKPGLVLPLAIGEVGFQFLGKFELPMTQAHLDRGQGTEGLPAIFGPKDAFVIGQVPVTQLMYLLANLYSKRTVPTPSYSSSGPDSVVLHLAGKDWVVQPNHPVERVSYWEALEHSDRVSALTGLRYYIPSVEQWELASLGGSWGQAEGRVPDYSKSGWFHYNAQKRTHAVGQWGPSAFQLYEMSGNVWERTVTQRETEEWIKLVTMGGSYLFFASPSRVSYRSYSGEEAQEADIGIRLARHSSASSPPQHTFTLGTAAPESNTNFSGKSELAEKVRSLVARIGALLKKRGTQ